MNLNAIDPAVGMCALLHWSARERLFPLPPNTHTPLYNLHMYVQVRGLSAACPLTPGDTFATAFASAAAAAVKFAEYLHNNRLINAQCALCNFIKHTRVFSFLFFIQTHIKLPYLCVNNKI